MKKILSIVMAAAGFIGLFAEGDTFTASLIIKGASIALLLLGLSLGNGQTNEVEEA